jgi:hypothetical protein
MPQNAKHQFPAITNSVILQSTYRKIQIDECMNECMKIANAIYATHESTA